MQIIFAIFGLFWTYFGMFFSIAIFLGNDASWKLITAISAFAFGAICFLASIKSYKGSWWTIFGGAIFVIDSFISTMEVNKHFKNLSAMSKFSVSIMFLLVIISIVFIKIGHSRHNKILKIRDAVENNHSFFGGWGKLTIFLLYCLALGVLNAACQYETYIYKLFLVEGIIFNFVLYWWYYNDRGYNKYKPNSFLNIGLIIFPYVALPIYFFKSRGSIQARYMSSVFLAIFTYSHNLMFAGVILWTAT